MISMRESVKRVYRVARVGLLAAGVVCAGGSAAWLAGKTAAPPAPPAAKPADEVGKVRRIGPDRVAVPAEVAERVGLRFGTAAVPVRPIKLPPFPATLAPDIATYARPRSRFAGDVVEIGKTADPTPRTLSTEPVPGQSRDLDSGDTVRKGQLLAVVWSKDLGEKKSALVDAITNLRSHEQTLKRLEDLQRSAGGTSERSLREAEQAVRTDKNAIATAERTLRTWKLTEEEIAAVRAEAERLLQPGAKPIAAGEWARVEVRAPRDGVILEKNVFAGDIVDTTTDLFKICELGRLAVWAHVYEEDLPLLTALPKPIKWTIAVPARPGSAVPGTLEKVSPVIDQNQHTALATGHVENPAGDLRVGQYVTVSVELPPPAGEVEVPAEAVVEDGRESVVFVQPDPARGEYVRHAVKVARRSRDVVFLRPAESGVRPGDRVVTAGALLLREAMDTLPAHRFSSGVPPWSAS
jgi:cobalt-zinc-cadmium efflux system membrane fusion protein